MCADFGLQDAGGPFHMYIPELVSNLTKVACAHDLVHFASNQIFLMHLNTVLFRRYFLHGSLWSEIVCVSALMRKRLNIFSYNVHNV